MSQTDVTGYLQNPGGAVSATATGTAQGQIDASIGTGDTQSQFQSSIGRAINGDALSDADVQAGFAMGAAGAASLATGASVAATIPVIGPLAIAVFGIGYAAGLGLQDLLRNQFGVYFGGDPAKCPTSWQTAPASGVCPYVQDGSFERWARPIITKAHELLMNCQPIPAVGLYPNPNGNYDYGDPASVNLALANFFAGMVKAWNDGNLGSPMRTVSSWWIDPSSTPSNLVPTAANSTCAAAASASSAGQQIDPEVAASCGACMGDVVQQMLDAVHRASGYKVTYIVVADPQPRAATGGGGATAVLKTVATHAAPFAVGGAVSGLLYAWATGKAVDRVFGSAWAAFAGYLKDALESVEGAVGRIGGRMGGSLPRIGIPGLRENPLRHRGRRLPTKIVSLLFPKGKYTTATARSWARRHGYRSSKVHVTDRYIRLRQLPPGRFSIERTITLGKGIKAVVGR